MTNNDVLSADKDVRIVQYAQRILLSEISDFRSGVIPEPEDDTATTTQVVLNEFELYAYFKGKLEFRDSIPNHNDDQYRLNLAKIVEDAHCWYYVPLGMRELESVSLTTWEKLFNEWYSHIIEARRVRVSIMEQRQVKTRKD